MNQEHIKNKRGQVALSTIIGIALVTSLIGAGATQIMSYVFTSPQSQAAAIGILQSDVAVIQNQQTSQDTAINTLTVGLDNINKNVIKLLVHNGIQPTP